MPTPLSKKVRRRVPSSRAFPKGIDIELEPPDIIKVRPAGRRDRWYGTTVESLLWILAKDAAARKLKGID